MRYHLTRTLVWEQQANLDHFPTHTIHQITLPPFAEYAILQVNAITGTDHFARLVQWMSMLTILVGISEIAKRMGGSLRHQLLASLLTISIPMVIAQSTSTMNDLVVAGFLIIFINFAFRFKDNPKNLFYVGATGIALGLAFLSKSTAFIFALPFSIWIAYRVIVKEGFGLSVFKVGGVIVMAALVINSGHFTRNINTFGSPLGNNLETVNEIFTTRSLSSNVIRNIQMHMPGVKGENPALINLIGAGARKITWNLHDLTGMDYEDPRTTYHNKYKGFASPGGFNTAEGRAGAFIHLCLIFFTGLFSKSKLKTRDQKQYLILLVTTFLFFSFILKAQTPINRLIMPLFVIWIPLISFTVYPSKKTYWYILPLMVWLCALPWLFNGKTRPLIRSEASAAAAWPSAGIEAYFVRKPSLHPIYDEITDFITETQCKEIGVVFLHNEFFYEYPFWMMLREKGFDGKIQHMLVENESKVHEDFSYSPCIIISNAEMNSFPEFSLTPYDQFLIYTKN
ncbi:MAG: glycosyltransferase family 39 protein [Chloroflexota bacterium]